MFKIRIIIVGPKESYWGAYLFECQTQGYTIFNSIFIEESESHKSIIGENNESKLKREVTSLE